METFLVGDVVRLKQDTGRSMELVIRSPFPASSMLCVSECGTRIVWASEKDLALVRRPVPVSFDSETIQAIAKAVTNELRVGVANRLIESVKRTSKKHRAMMGPLKTQPPVGYRMLGDAKDEPRYSDDLYWSLSVWIPIGFQMSYANRDNWAACRKVEETEKRYRTPTLEDLKNGPIECEVRDCDIQAWRYATLQSIYPGAAYEFRVQKHGSLVESRYAQCRIEDK